MLHKAQTGIFDELFIDNFAGGGGASTGIELATGKPVDIAINHDAAAIAMHKANHPYTEHYCESVWEIDPRKVCKGKTVALAWFSPDCKHFSKAKGGKPVSKNIRGLAWVAVRWAATVRPRVIILENVEEFKTWGPIKDGYPDMKQKGKTFNSFVNALKAQGYEVEWRELKACDYGAPTIRKRFFLIARCDGSPIVWPKPTHGNPSSQAVKSGHLKPWRTAADIIDWNITCLSIFERNKPLAENTLKRIARGLQKFVFDNPEPFIINYKFQNDPEDINQPLSTITSVNGHYIVTPYLTQYHSYETESARGQNVNNPLLTLDTSNRYTLVYAFITKYYGGFYNGAGHEVESPLPTLTTRERCGVVTSHMVKLRKNCDGQAMSEPLHTITSGGFHFGEVRAFLIKYYGQGTGQEVNKPLDTVVSKDRFGLVTIKGEEYQIIDIGMRMLEPHELFAAQGFPTDYIIDRDYTGKKYPKSAQVARCGNAVPPPFAEALVRANLPEYATGKINTMQELKKEMAV